MNKRPHILLTNDDGIHSPGLWAAAGALPEETDGVKSVAHLATRDGKRISLIELKQFCSRHLPLYFVPDLFEFHPALPKTSTDKIDYQRLQTRGPGPDGSPGAAQP